MRVLDGDSRMPTRRHLLAAVGVTASMAGCAGALGSEGDEENGSTPEGAVYLGELHVQNNHDVDHRIQLAIEADDEMIHLESYDLSGNSSRRVSGDWEDTAADYRLHAKLDDGDVVSSSVTDGVSDEVDCVRVLARVDEDGRLGVWNGAGCDTDESLPDED